MRRAAVPWLFAAACRTAEPGDGTPLVVQWSGCDAVLATGCAIDGAGPRTLVAWVDTTEPGLHLVDDRRHTHDPEGWIDGGWRFRVPIDADVGALRLVDANGLGRWRLAIVRRDGGDDHDADLPVALEEAEALPLAHRGRALRRGFSAAHARGDADLAQRYAVASYDAAVEAGDWTTACGVAQAAAFSAQHLSGETARGIVWLDLATWCETQVPEAAPGAAYARGVLSAAAGRRVEALELLYGAWRGAARLDRSEAHAFARYYAGVLAEAGFTVAAERTLEGLAPDVPAGCPRAVLELDHGWLLLLRGEADGARDALQRARTLFAHGFAELAGAGACAQGLPLLAETFRINLAHAAMLLDDPADARHQLEGIDRARLDPMLGRWYDRLHAALAMAEGHPDEARAWLDAVGASAPDADHDATWRDRVLAAQLAEAMGDATAAAQHDAAAELALDRAVASFAQGLAAGAWLGARPDAAARRIARAIAKDQRHDAWCLLRASRRRPLLATAAAAARLHADGAVAERLRRHREQVDALARELPGADRTSMQLREDRRAALDRALTADLVAQLPSDGSHAGAPCAPPPPGTLELAFHPMAHGGWYVFAALDDALEILAFAGSPAGLDDDELSARLLQPLAGPIGRARRLRVLPAGAWNAVDVHALPWRDGPLVAALPVAYGIDLPVPPTRERVGVAISFVDADPLRSLVAYRPALRAASEAVAGTATWSEPTRLDAMRSTLASADAWLYFGHGAGPSPTGRVPWQASRALVLADEQRLDAFDVLSADAEAPRHVALLGCGTGAVDPSLPPGSVTLPQAFLLRGARGVVATSDDVAPAVAVAIARRLIADLGARPDDFDLAASLRAAQLGLRDQDPTAPWATFRAWEP